MAGAQRPQWGHARRVCLAWGLTLGMGVCLAQPATAPQQGKPGTPAQTAAAVAAKPIPGGPTWTELTAEQRLSLAPLKDIWSSIGAAHKRKWLALSPNFGRLSKAEQQRLHSRMVEWASLSAAQRLEARLNFAQIPSLSSEEKNAQWQAYQALPKEEKKALAAQAAPLKTPGTAAAPSGASKKKLAAVPLTRPETHAAAVRPPASMVTPHHMPSEGESQATPAAAAASAPAVQAPP